MVDNQFHTLIQAILKGATGGATSADIATVVTALTAVITALTDDSQTTKITDGTDTLLVNANGSINVQIAPTSRTPLSVSTTSSGNSVAGYNSVCFSLSSDFSGTINGVSREASSVIMYTAPLFDTVASMPYTRTAGTINIDYL